MQNPTTSKKELKNKMYKLFEKFDLVPLNEISEILYEQASPYGEINTIFGRWVFINPINKQWFSREELNQAYESGKQEERANLRSLVEELTYGIGDPNEGFRDVLESEELLEALKDKT